MAGLDRVVQAAFAPDGRTLWLLGEADPTGAQRDPEATWPRVVGLDIRSGVASHDLRLPRPSGALSLDELIVTEHRVWVSGSYRIRPGSTPADPELVIPGQHDFRLVTPLTGALRTGTTKKFIARTAVGEPGQVVCLFDDDARYFFEAHSMQADQAASERQRVRVGRETEADHTRYRLNEPSTGRTRLEVLGANNLDLTLSRDERYLLLQRPTGGPLGGHTIWRYDTTDQAWNWPRATRSQRLQSIHAVSPDGRAVAVVGVDGVANRIDFYLFDNTERYDPGLAGRMAAVLTPPPRTVPTPPPRRTVTLPGPDAELGPGPDASFTLEGLGRPWEIQVEPDGSRAYIVHRVAGEGQPIPKEDRVRCVDLATGQTVWDVASPFPWTHRINSRESTRLVLDPHYLIFVNTYAVQRGASSPDQVAPFHLRSQIRILHKSSGAGRDYSVDTAVHNSVYFSSVVIPPRGDAAGSTRSWPRTTRLVMIRHARPATVVDGRNYPAAWHWRLERWELPGGRRRVLMRSPTPESYDGAALGFTPRVDTLSLGEGGRSIVGWWSLSYRGERADHRFLDNSGTLLRFDTESGRRLGSQPLPEFGSEQFLSRYLPGGLWQVHQPDGQTMDIWWLKADVTAPELRVNANGWISWGRVQSRAMWWGYQQADGRVNREAVLRLDPWTGRIDGPRPMPPPSGIDGISAGSDMWSYARDGSAAVALMHPKEDRSHRPPVTLHRYDFPPVVAAAADGSPLGD
ncbi:MAG: hypothetical protein AAF333_13075 [Planctomycetota bacterium]